MIPEIGHFALIVALCISVVQALVPLIGTYREDGAWMAVARPAAQGQFVFVAIAFGCLAWSFVGNDFSVLNVASNSNSSLPVQYRFAATWGSHEGSLLLWVLMLTVWMPAVNAPSENDSVHVPIAESGQVASDLNRSSTGPDSERDTTAPQPVG